MDLKSFSNDYRCWFDTVESILTMVLDNLPDVDGLVKGWVLWSFVLALHLPKPSSERIHKLLCIQEVKNSHYGNLHLFTDFPSEKKRFLRCLFSLDS